MRRSIGDRVRDGALRQRDEQAGVEDRPLIGRQKTAMVEIRTFYRATIAEQELPHQSFPNSPSASAVLRLYRAVRLEAIRMRASENGTEQPTRLVANSTYRPDWPRSDPQAVVRRRRPRAVSAHGAIRSIEVGSVKFLEPPVPFSVPSAPTAYPPTCPRMPNPTFGTTVELATSRK